MGGNAVLEGMEEDLGDVLVAVVRIKKVETPILGAHGQRPRGDRFRGIPHKLCTDGVAVGGIQPLDAEVAVINEAEVRDDRSGAGLLIVHTATEAIEDHGDNRVAPRPASRPVFGVVDDRPNASGSFDYCLVTIRIVLGREVVDRRVLVKVVSGVGFAFGGGTVSDIVVSVGLVLAGEQFVAHIVGVIQRFRLRHHGTGFGDGGTAAEQVVGVGVLRGDGAIDGVGHAGEKVALGFVLPNGGRAVGIGEAGLQVSTYASFGALFI